MNWSNYIIFAISSIGCWLIPFIFNVKQRNVITYSYIIGIIIYSAFIAGLWYNQGYPPLKTVNDTRLWYSWFLTLIGFIIYIRWNYRWLLCFISGLSCIFIILIIISPKAEASTLLPVLQSIWFIPHVLSYMLSYSLLLLSTIVGYYQFYRQRKGENIKDFYVIMNNLISLGIIFLTIGLLIGMQWANEAWGSFWSWDIKEIWALITLLTYLFIFHYRLYAHNNLVTLLLLSCGLLFFMITWLGIKYLPNTDSMHLYSYIDAFSKNCT